jgi:guanylate kinase
MVTHANEFIFIFTGPDGSGRKTTADAVGLTLGLKKVISYTTRTKRPIEEDGQDYHFVEEGDFRKAVENGEFIEQLNIGGYLYGIKGKDIETGVAEGSIYLILNRHGTAMIRELYGDKVIRIFVYADRNTIVQRQREDGLTEQEIQSKLVDYDEDINYASHCEHSVENIGDLGHTVFHVTNVIEEYLDRGLIDKD